MPCNNQYYVTLDKKNYPDCPIDNACDICKMLKNEILSLEEYILSPDQEIVTLKKIKNQQGNYIYPLTEIDAQKINSVCYTGYLKSCTGVEEIKLISFDIQTGKLKIKRENRQNLTHKSPIYLDLGFLSIENYNKIVDILCELYIRYCSKYPECATQEKSGIGKASYIAPQSQGECPIFITNDDPKWQILITNAGLNDQNSNSGLLAELIKFLAEKDCENGSNKDALIDIVNKLCGKTDCISKIVKILCDSLEEVKIGANVKGVKLNNRYFEAEYGLKPLILHKNRNTGTINPGSSSNYIAPALSGDSNNVLTENLTGKGGQNGYKGLFLVDTKTITINVAGSLKIDGYMSASHQFGLMYATVAIKSGNVTHQTIILNPVDNSSLTRGDNYGNYAPIISSLSLSTITDIIQPGQYQINLEYHFILPPNVITDKSTSVFAWDWSVTFLPS